MLSASVQMINLLLVSLTGAFIVFVWLEEIPDIPHLVGFQKTPVNWVQSLMETIVIAVLASIVIWWCDRLLKRIRYLEGLSVICSNCKRIRLDSDWISIEEYMRRHSSMQLSHSICPHCAKALYGYVETEEQDVKEPSS